MTQHEKKHSALATKFIKVDSLQQTSTQKAFQISVRQTRSNYHLFKAHG